MKNKIFFLFLLLIISCNKKIEKEISINKNIEINSEENFNTFFERFKNDSVFQKERVVFPLKYEIFNTDDLGKEKSKIAEKDYKFFKIDENEVFLEKKEFKDSVKVILKGKDNGILIENKFVKTNGVWKLIFFDDQST